MLDIRGCKSGKLMGMSPTDMRQDGKVLWDTLCLKCGRHRLITARGFNKHVAGGRLACEDCQEIGRPKTRLGLSGASIYSAWQSAVSGGLTSKSSYKRWVLVRNTINSGDWTRLITNKRTMFSGELMSATCSASSGVPICTWCS